MTTVMSATMTTGIGTTSRLTISTAISMAIAQIIPGPRALKAAGGALLREAPRPAERRAAQGGATRGPGMAGGLLMALVLLLSGCAGNVPRHIAQAPLVNPGVATVAAAPQDWVGQPVRWGGVIVSVQTKAEETRVELAARELGSSGRPKLSDHSPGRFIARMEGFLDPSIFRAERELTVYGTLEAAEEGRIGERPYTYPVVKVQEYQLWSEYVPAVAPYDPWWDQYYLYDPFLNPYRPYYWPRAYLRSGFSPYYAWPRASLYYR